MNAPPITPEVEAISRLHLEGNVIPHTWYRNITLPSGHPDVIAITLLADIVYWYRWREIRDEATGAVMGYARRFKADRLQRSYSAFADLYAFTKRQVQDAVYRLVAAGLIVRELRTVTLESGAQIFNVVYLAPVATAIAAITYRLAAASTPPPAPMPPVDPTEDMEPEPEPAPESDPLSRFNVTPLTLKRDTSHVLTGQVSRFNGTPVTSERETYTEITLENTTEITTLSNSNSNGDGDGDGDGDTEPLTAEGDDGADASNVAVVSPTQSSSGQNLQEVRDILSAFGIVEPNLTRASQRSSWADAQAWIWAVQGGTFTNAPGMVVKRLLAGDQAPPTLLALAREVERFDARVRARLPELARDQHTNQIWFQIPPDLVELGVTEGLIKRMVAAGVAGSAGRPRPSPPRSRRSGKGLERKGLWE